jgi:uncharacterized phage protein (TIGR01671 family)
MKEILFRGIRKDGGNKGQWIEGYYCEWIDSHNNKHYIIKSTNGYENDIIPESVGQFIGFCDKKGTKIFEDDIIINSFGVKFIIKYNLEIGEHGGQYCQVRIDNGFSIKIHHLFDSEVIGNIHENKELVEKP